MIAKLLSTSDANAARERHAQLISLVARNRDQAAFEGLFRHFAPRVKTYCIRLGADAALAEEITQETMVSVWSNAAQFDPAKASVSTWVFTIARNLTIDRFRKSRRPQFDPLDPAFVPDPAERPDTVLEQGEMQKRVQDALQTLSLNERDVLMLSFYRQVSHGEIARQLDLPLGTVKSRIRLAVAKIRLAIRPHDEASDK
jgi:RNA polymerase sigma-70 factor, ECF subfamily